MEKSVDEGSQPLFGCPTVIYAEDEDFVSTLTEYVLPDNSKKTKVSEMLASLKQERAREEEVFEKFRHGLSPSQKLPFREVIDPAKPKKR